MERLISKNSRAIAAAKSANNNISAVERSLFTVVYLKLNESELNKNNEAWAFNLFKRLSCSIFLLIEAVFFENEMLYFAFI